MPDTRAEPPIEHFTFSPAQDMGSLLMVILQVALHHPDGTEHLKFGKAGQIHTITFHRDENGHPHLDALEVNTDTGTFLLQITKRLT